MTCNGQCHKYKAQKPFGIGRYTAGQKRCQNCEIFVECKGVKCPCCGQRLRNKPHRPTPEQKLRHNSIKKCMGYRYGTGCTDSFSPTKDDELCYNCRRMLYPELFAKSKGVKIA